MRNIIGPGDTRKMDYRVIGCKVLQDVSRCLSAIGVAASVSSKLSSFSDADATQEAHTGSSSAASIPN